MPDLNLFGTLLPSVIPELEPLGLRTEILTLREGKTGERVNCLRIFGPGCEEHGVVLSELGFKFDRQSGSWLSGDQVDRTRLLLAFSIEEQIAPAGIEAGADRVIDAVDASPRGIEPSDSGNAPHIGDSSGQGVGAPARVRGRAELIGVNAMDAAVYQTAGGDRFYRISGEEDVYEDEELEQPGLFLRAPTKEQLPIIARGLIAPALKGRALPADEADRYLARINEGRSAEIGKEDLISAVYEAVGSVLANAKSPEQARAIANRLHRFTGGSFKDHGANQALPFPILNAEIELKPQGRIEVERLADFRLDEVENVLQGTRPAGGEGRTLLEISGFGGAAPTDKMVREILGDLPSRYVLEGAQFVTEPLLPETKLFICIGARRPEQVDMAVLPQAVFQVGYASGPEPLAAWLDGVAQAQAAASAWFEAIRRGEVTADTVETIEHNRWQVPAQPLSKVGKPTLMVPVNLKEPFAEAQRNFLRRHPEGMDEYVAAKLRRPVSSLGQIFLPEQVDSLGFDLDAEERHRACLCANLTGTGKGRVAAGRIQVSLIEGNKLLVLTESTVGIGTLIRDMINIGAFQSGDGQFAILNAGPELTEAATNSIVFGKRVAQDLRAQFMPNGRPSWPDGVKVVFGTYSCFNRLEDDSWRSEWLEAVVDQKTHLVLDESHNVASPESQSASNLVNAIAAAGHTLYLSATYAPSGDKTGPYFSLISPDADAGLATLLPRTISNAGEAGHEEFGNMLARDGAMVRFERSFEEIEFSMEVSPNAQGNKEKLDLLAPVIRQMLAYARVIKKTVALHNIGHVAGMKSRFEAQREELGAVFDQQEREAHERARQEDWEAIRKNGVFRAMSFGSPLYRIQKAFNAAVMVSDDDGFVAQAINHLKEGRKPIIVVDQTSESVLADIQDMAAEMGVEAPRPMFRHMLDKILKSMGRAVNRNRERIDVAADNLYDNYIFARSISAQLVEGLHDSILEQDKVGAFNLQADDLKDVKPAGKLRDWLDDAVPTMLAQSFEAIEADTGHEMDVTEREKISAIVGLVVEESFMTTKTSPSDIAAEMKAAVEDFNQTFDLASFRRSVEDMIAALPDMPISFIDTVKQRIEAEGFKVGEITGRRLAVDTNGNVVPRKRERIESVRDRFNNGDYEAGLLNSAGASQIDLHSDAAFKNQGQRVVMVLQLPPAQVLAQMIGRADRIGQVIPPKVEIHVNGIPTEVRFIANLNQHLARLNANLAAIRKHPLMCEQIPPLLTRDGDIATARVLVENKSILRELELDIPENYLEKLAATDTADINGEDDVDALKAHDKPEHMIRKAERAGIKSSVRTQNRRLANEVLSRASILPSTVQGELLREIEAQYWARIEEREALGLDTSGVKMIEGIVTARATRVLDMGDGGLEPHLRSAFRAPLNLTLATIESKVPPMRGKDVISALDRAIAKGDAALLMDRIDACQRQAHTAAMHAAAAGVGLENIQEWQANRAAKRAEALERYPLGGGIYMRYDGEVVKGVVVGYRDDDLDPTFEVAVPGHSRPRPLSLSQVMNSPRLHAAWEGVIGGARRATLKEFDQAVDLSRVEPRMILTGNNWTAVQFDAGKIVTWAEADGSVSRGVLLPKTDPTIPPGVTRIRTVGDLEKIIDSENFHYYEMSVPLLPWSGGGGDRGVELRISVSQGGVRGKQWQARLRVRGASTEEANLRKSKYELMLAERHLEAFLGAAGGIATVIAGENLREQIDRTFAPLRAYVAAGEAAGEITDRVERQRTKRLAKQASSLLKVGVPINLKTKVIDGTEKEQVLQQVNQVLQQVFNHGLEALHMDHVYVDVKQRYVRDWLLNGGIAPRELDGFVEVNPVRRPAPAPVNMPAVSDDVSLDGGTVIPDQEAARPRHNTSFGGPSFG